jgi:hypothetical protein
MIVGVEAGDRPGVCGVNGRSIDADGDGVRGGVSGGDFIKAFAPLFNLFVRFEFM